MSLGVDMGEILDLWVMVVVFIGVVVGVGGGGWVDGFGCWRFDDVLVWLDVVFGWGGEGCFFGVFDRGWYGGCGIVSVVIV